MNEITFQFSSANLRKLSEFLNKCANEIDNEADWEHEHLETSEEEPRIIVFKE